MSYHPFFFLKNFLLILAGFHVMYPDPTHLPVPSLLLSALVTSTPKQILKVKLKKKTKKQKTNHHQQDLGMEAVK